MVHWKEFKRRNLWQHSVWQKFQEAIGRKTWLLETDDASALIVKHELPYGLSWLEIPRGPLTNDEKSLIKIFEQIIEISKKEKSIFVRFSSFVNYKITRLQDYKIIQSHFDHHPETSLIIDIAQSEEDILGQMKPKGRYNIKVAQKHGVTVKASQNVDDFYSILQKTGGRDGFGIHAKSYYQKMIDTLGEHVQLLQAEYEGQIIAGGIFVYLDEWGIYYYGASDHQYRKVMAPYLLQWEAIQEAKRRGCKYYDFLGIAPEDVKNHPWAGVTGFKKKFGGEVVNYPKAKELVLQKFWYWAYRLYKK